MLGEDQFRCVRGRGTKNAVGMLRIISERTLEIDEELCACFIDWKKEFGLIKWVKLMQIQKKTCIDWRKRRLISKLYIDQGVKSTTRPRRDKKCKY